jgi:hypothetical protein
MTATATAAPTNKVKAPNNSSQLTDTEADVPRAVYTIKEFCKAHRLSEAMYFKLRNAGLGPREVRAGRRVTVSLEAANDWRREREK